MMIVTVGCLAMMAAPRYVRADDRCEKIASLAKEIALARDSGVDEVEAEKLADTSASGDPATLAKMHSEIEIIYDNPSVSPAEFESTALDACRRRQRAATQ
jgi:hypothetical protein